MTELNRATDLPAMLAATQRAARGKRTQPEIARCLMDAETNCLAIAAALRKPMDDHSSWWPGESRTFWIRDPKPRLITASPFPDRVVHHALCATFEPALERYAIQHSYACRRGKGQRRAILTAQRFSRRADWVFKGDIRAYFYSIPHERLLRRLRKLSGDDAVCDRIERIVSVEGSEGRGLAIGSLVSQHLANFYLGRLDHWLTDELGFGKTVRYMDDFLVFGERDALGSLRHRLRKFLEDELELELNTRVSRLIPVADGIPFLGFRIFAQLIRVAPARWRRFRRRYEKIAVALNQGSVDEVAAAESLASQFAHFEQFDTQTLRRDYLYGLQRGQKGHGRKRHRPGYSRRFVQEQPAQRARVQSQQERARQAQRQPGFSSLELKTCGQLIPGERSGKPAAERVVTVSSRIHGLSQGFDQTTVPYRTHRSIETARLGRGTLVWRPSHFYSRKAELDELESRTVTGDRRLRSL